VVAGRSKSAEIHDALAHHLRQEAPGWSVTTWASGRAALAAAVLALGIDWPRVAVPGYVCPAVPMALRHAGAEPVYVDCVEGSLGFDVADLHRRIESGTLHAAVVPLTYGQVDRPLAAIPSGLPVILDAAYLGGAELPAAAADERVRSVVWSFNFKTLTGVGGGVLLRRDPGQGAVPGPRLRTEELRRLANYTLRAILRERIPRFLPGARRPQPIDDGRARGPQPMAMGAMSTLQAAVALTQWRRRRELRRRVRDTNASLETILGSAPHADEVRLLPGGPFPHLLPLTATGAAEDRRAFAQALRLALHRRGIQTEDPYPMPTSDVVLERAQEIRETLILVPCGASLRPALVARIGAALAESLVEAAGAVGERAA